MMLPDNVEKSNETVLAHIITSLGSAGLAAGIPGGLNGWGWIVGSVNGDARLAVPPHVKEMELLYCLYCLPSYR
jgi:hypothetical protein